MRVRVRVMVRVRVKLGALHLLAKLLVVLLLPAYG